MCRSETIRPFPALTLLVALAMPWSASAQAPATPATPDQAVRAPQRVAILGASVSAGFRDGPLFGGEAGNDTVSLQQVLAPRLDGQDAQISSYADLMMFRDPVSSGGRQVKRALRAEPDLLVGIDFLFWFGYGAVPRGQDEAGFRMARLRQGLDLLAELRCPMLIGDLADMRGAAARMLAPSWVPPPEQLAAMNEAIAVWAKDRGNVRLFPLAREVKALKEDGVALPLADGALATGPGDLLQGDRLHATRLGMAWLGLRLEQELWHLLPPAHPLRARAGAPWRLDRYVEAVGAGPDLEVARTRAAARTGSEAPATGKDGGRRPR